MPIRQAVRLMTVRDDACDGRDVIASLDVNEDGMSAADVVQGAPGPRRRLGADGIARRLDDADRNAPSVREVKGLRDDVVWIIAATAPEILRSKPFLNKTEY